MSADLILSGISLGLGATLLVGGIAKARDRSAFELALARLLPRGTWRALDSTSLARAILLIELIVGAAMVYSAFSYTRIVPVLASAIIAAFLGVNLHSQAAEVSCGCFGSTSRPARWPDIARTALILAAAIATASRPASIGAGSPGVAVVALAVASIGCWPLLRAALLRAYREGATADRGEAGVTRRRFVTQGLALAGALGLVLVPTAGASIGPQSCGDKYVLCHGCCNSHGKGSTSACNACCVECYGQCQTFFDCAPGSCPYGCWP